MPRERFDGVPRALVAVLLLLLGTGAGVDAAEPAGILDGFPAGRLTIVTRTGRCLFLEVRIARTGQQRSRGLMYVTALGEFEGMYFPYPEPALITMWMKNTYIPLDMAFVRADGRIAGVALHTTPLSLERIPAPEPVTGVLEVNAGSFARWEVAAGDRVLLEP